MKANWITWVVLAVLAAGLFMLNRAWPPATPQPEVTLKLADTTVTMPLNEAVQRLMINADFQNKMLDQIIALQNVSIILPADESGKVDTLKTNQARMLYELLNRTKKPDDQ